MYQGDGASVAGPAVHPHSIAVTSAVGVGLRVGVGVGGWGGGVTGAGGRMGVGVGVGGGVHLLLGLGAPVKRSTAEERLDQNISLHDRFSCLLSAPRAPRQQEPAC